MNRHAKPVSLLMAASLLLTACASAPMHYYTLVAPMDGMAAPTTNAASLPFELLPVGIPAQVDQPQLVVREGGQGMAVLGSERWIAPLGDEVRSALSSDLARELLSQDVSGLPAGDKPMLRIKLDLRRFDSQPGGQALIEGAWSVRLLHGAHPATLSCTSQISEPVGPGYPALVQGHQQAIARMATQIAAVGRALGAGEAPTCPLE
ncbi:PqiC family protein [Rhodanobacter sp. AS-Z3]|uniref:PqiC family protein n=1 Tax=Rhodanobacter sp. AS-Z3 TaxID=3031330 RepID=UPI0024792313|nr:PqiC family protein [Rhodanobacter sp. AS-Z3]WEN16587.1 PqiC family protein [Rhodanobacter sp. AS-Z3]